MSKAIKTLTGTNASGQSLAAGRVYAVPGEVSERDAQILTGMGRAEWCEAAVVKPAATAPRRKAGKAKG